MWFDRTSKVDELEKRVAAIEKVNTAQTKVIQKNQKHMFLIAALACLGLTISFGNKVIESEDKDFLYDSLRFLMGGAGLAASAKTLELEVKPLPQLSTSVCPQDTHTTP